MVLKIKNVEKEQHSEPKKNKTRQNKTRHDTTRETTQHNTRPRQDKTTSKQDNIKTRQD
jgi:hypothetical protein